LYSWEPLVSDVAFIALTIAVFTLMAVVARGVERLVGPVPGSDRADLFSGQQGTEQGTAYPGEDSGGGSGGRALCGGVRGVGAHPDGQVVR
jgi:hypothetical protein